MTLYRVLALEGLAQKLVDPFGTDVTDLKVYDLFTQCADEVLEAVNALDWDCDFHVRESLRDEPSYLGCSVLRGSTAAQFRLAEISSQGEAERES